MIRGQYPSIPAILLAFLLTGCFLLESSAQTPKRTNAKTDKGSNEVEVADQPDSEMRPIIESYVVDRGSLFRSFFVNNSPARRERLRKFYSDALERIQKLDFD